jgi:hypothetical protein
MLQLRADAVVVGLALVGFVFPLVAPDVAPRDARETLGTLEPAIPSAQDDFDQDLQATSSSALAFIPNSQVTINNGTSTRNVVVTFSAEARVTDPPDLFILAFSVDGGACTFGGPVAFTMTNNAGAFPQEARTAVHILSIGAGSHTIRPCWRKADDGDGLGTIQVFRRSLTAEGRTK